MIDSDEIGRLREMTFFRGVPDELLPWLLSEGRIRSLRRTAIVFQQGGPVTHFYVVLSGWVKIFRLRPDGTETIIEIFGPGESFAEGAPFMSDGYPASAEMVEDGRLFGIPVNSYTAKLHERPELAMKMLAVLAVRLKHLVGRIETMHSQTTSQRLAEFLLKFCPLETGDAVPIIRLPYEKHLIANRLGMKPETFSRAIASLRKHGAIIDGREARIIDRQALHKHVAAE